MDYRSGERFLLVPRPDGFVSSPTDSCGPGLDFETWEITNPRGHGTRGRSHFIELMVGSIHENTKSVISGNCATISPIAGTPTKLSIRSQKCAPRAPGWVLVIWLRVLSRSRPANTTPMTVPIKSKSTSRESEIAGRGV